MEHAPEDILRFEGDDVRELDKDAAQDPEWLVDGLFASDETTIIAGSSKSLKTTILCDLVISLAIGKPWLQRFRTPAAKRVLFITGENSRKSAARKLLRSVHAHGYRRLAELPEGSRLVTEAFPNLVDPVHRREIKDVVDEYEIEVVIVDPLYRGLMGTEQGNVADRGEAILGFADAIGEASLILSHHFTKGASRDGNQPRLPMLEDMTGAGVAESCGNWMMINRNKQWEKGQRHDLSLMCGSREGSYEALRLLFDDREWSAEFQDWNDYKASLASEKQTPADKALGKVYKVIEDAGHWPVSIAKIVRDLGIRREVAKDALISLKDRKAIVPICPYLIRTEDGFGYQHTNTGYVLPDHAVRAVNTADEYRKKKQQEMDLEPNKFD